jgi:nucleoside-diphosphate-sugar epimerase
VRAFDLPTRANRRRARRFGDRVETLWGDVRSPADLDRAVAGVAAAFHFAAVLYPFTERHPEVAEAINVGGTRNLLEAIRRAGATPRVLYPSSVSVYGPADGSDRLLGPDDPIRPTDHYTRHKAACETLVRESGLPWLVLRVGVSLDTRQSKADLEVLRAMFEVSPDNPLELVHPDDVGRAAASALERPDAWNRVLCLGGGEGCRIRHYDLMTCAFGSIGVRIPREAFGGRPFYTHWMDDSEAHRLLEPPRRTFADFREASARDMRTLRALLSPVRPLLRALLLRYSRPWRARRRSPRG